MLYVDITYHAATRLAEVTSLSTGGQDFVIATKGDDNSTILVLTYDDPDHTLDEFNVRAEYGVKLLDEHHNAYYPYTVFTNGLTKIPNTILSAVLKKDLPIQIVFWKEDGESGDEIRFCSLNILNAKVTYAIRATVDLTEPIDEMVNEEGEDAVAER